MALDRSNQNWPDDLVMSLGLGTGPDDRTMALAIFAMAACPGRMTDRARVSQAEFVEEQLLGMMLYYGINGGEEVEL